MEGSHQWQRQRRELQNKAPLVLNGIGCGMKCLTGDCNVPQKFIYNPKLGHWVNTQPRHCQYKMLKDGKHSVIVEERIARKLENVGFKWRRR